MPDAVSDLLQQAAARPTVTAFVDDGGAVDYRTLAGRVGGLAKRLASAPETVGILAPNGIEWVVASLACQLAAKTAVPLPPFFSPGQLDHVIGDAGVGYLLVSAETTATAARLGLPACVIAGVPAADPERIADGGWRLIIYTSGTTGAPKGVQLSARQVSASVAALAAVTGAGADDRYLSLLPFALLLEQIAGIHLPIRVGAMSHIAGRAGALAMAGDMAALADAVATTQPSSTVLVPGLLEGWVKELEKDGRRAPQGLRFVAVGGAHVPPDLAAAAWRLGIPVHEGYGLSECCSVVAVNQPGARRPGSVGRPLPGISVEIEDGEIVVAGPAVMDGYLGGERGCGRWRTGDLGAFDNDGFLYVFGRRDNVIVTSLGRNISPEWIEAMIVADRRIERCCLVAGEGPYPMAVVVPAPAFQSWFENTADEEVDALVAGLCREAPAHARPHRVIVVGETAFAREGLLMPNGAPRRHDVEQRYVAAATDKGEAVLDVL